MGAALLLPRQKGACLFKLETRDSKLGFPVRVTFQLTYQEFRRGMRLAARREEDGSAATVPAWVLWIPLGLTLTVTIWLLVWVRGFILPQWLEVQQLLGYNTLFIVWLVLMFLISMSGRVFWIRQLWDTSPGFRGEQYVEADAHGLSNGREHYSIAYVWPGVQAIFGDPRVLVIETDLGQLVIPKRAFASPQEAEEFERLVASYAGGEPRGFPVQPA